MRTEAIDKDLCVIDARVSSVKQLSGGGLDNQEVVCSGFSIQQNWEINEIYSKAYSGRKEEREDFELIISDLVKKQKAGIKIKYYVIKSIDRFTRNGEVTYKEMKQRLTALGIQLVDVYGTIQAERNTLDHLGVEFSWSRFSPSESSEAMEALRGKAEVRDILTRMIGAEITQTRKGYSMRLPNDGYLNIKEIIDGRVVSVLKQDTQRAIFYKTLYEMRASGKYSDEKIADKINALGYLSKPRKIHHRQGKENRVIGMTTPMPMTVKQLQKVVRRTMYAGVKNEKWNGGTPVFAMFASNEAPIVPVETFNKANRGSVYIQVQRDRDGKRVPKVLFNYDQDKEQKKTRKKYNSLYKYDKMVTCDLCHKPLKNSGTKGNKGKSGKGFHGYHCDRVVDQKKHYFRVPKDDYEKSITGLLNRIEFSDDFKKKLEERLIKKYREREKEILGQSIVISDNVGDLKKEQLVLLDSFNRTNSDVVRRSIEEKVDDLEKRINKATEERDKIEIKERDIKSFVKYAKDLVEHPAKMLANNSNPLTQSALFKLVFDEPLTHSQIVNGTPKLSFIFKLSGSKTTDKSSLVTPRRIELRFLG